jgi:hypothetical protein
MKSIYLLSALLLTVSQYANAFSGDQRREAFRSRADGVRAEMFAEFKSIEAYSHKERIRILKEADACIQAASDRNQYQSCEQREKADRERVQEQVKIRHQAMRGKVADLKQGMLNRNR